MKKIAIPILLALAVPAQSLHAERPMLLSDISPSQLYSKSQIDSEIKNISKTNSEYSLLQNEFLILKNINELDVRSLSQDNIDYLKQNSQYQPQTFVKHDEGPLPLAIFDIASAAKFKLNQHYVHNESKDYQKLLGSNWEHYKHALISNELSSVSLAAKLTSMDGLSASQYSELARDLLANRDYQDPLVMKAVSFSKNAALIKSLLTKNSSADGYKLLVNKLGQFSDLEQSDILQSVVVENKALASSALIQYAKLPSNVQSNDWLISQLSDNYLGASAAKAIGITQSQEALLSAKAIIQDDSSSRTQVANALLALKFTNNDFAKAELRELLDQDQIRFQDMQQEVTKWLD